MARLFGFSIEDTEKTPAGVVSPIPPNRQDGSEYYVSSGFYGSYVDIEGVYKTENDLLRRYRQMSLYPECDSAIEDIVNEAIVTDTNDSPIEIELSNLKNITEEEFRRAMYNLGADKIDVDCFIIEAELLRSINKAFKPVFRDAKPEV